jgi:predicted DCC family thiol-disulfide oxidoreductase YuxK
MQVVFDADCGVCRASVEWVRKRDRRKVFEFIGNDAEALPAGVDRAQTEHTAIVIDGGRKLTRGEAVSRVLRELRGWSIAGQPQQLPGLKELANVGYDQFAKRRHRVSAAMGLNACAIDSSAARKPATAPPGAASGSR